MYCYQFLEELNKPDRNVKAVSILLTLSSSSSLGWIYSTFKIWQMSSCLWGHVPTFELGATSWQQPVLSGWLQPAALKFCLSCRPPLVIHESVSCSCHHLSQEAFEVMLATPGKGARVEQSIRLQLNHGDASAEPDSLPFSPLKCIIVWAF